MLRVIGGGLAGSEALRAHDLGTPTGANIATFTDDFDGNTRAGNGGYAGTGTAPDVGADEYEGAQADLTAPSISYSPLANTTSFAARTLTATITDATGVPTSGTGLPVLYWKINAGSYTAATATSLGGGQYQFTFGSGNLLRSRIWRSHRRPVTIASTGRVLQT